MTWLSLPYATIGKITVAILMIALTLTFLAILVATSIVAWTQTWMWISNKMWNEYEPSNTHPPVWKMRISGIALALSRFEIQKLPAAYREATKLDADSTADQALKTYVQRVFIDD